MLHLLLDTIAGDIMWLWPVSSEGFSLLSVPGRPGTHFLIAYLTHWSMALELSVWAIAIVLWQRRTSHV